MDVIEVGIEDRGPQPSCWEKGALGPFVIISEEA
jgi:hypothetical protein